MEDAMVVISRAAQAVTYPARFTLIGASNPCPCGKAGDPTGACNCAPGDIDRYSQKISGPLADRIDMNVVVGAVALRDLSVRTTGECSADVRARVERARLTQRRRFSKVVGVSCNAYASGRWLDSHTAIDGSARTLLQSAAERLSLSARGYHRVLKVARTIADLEDSRTIAASHIGEALRYRPLAKSGQVAHPLGFAAAPTPALGHS
jgi:magnesium chelatase family protein